MDFTDKGAETFERITREREQQRPAALQHGRRRPGRPPELPAHFAIVLDREIKSWPTIDFEQYPGGISA